MLNADTAPPGPVRWPRWTAALIALAALIAVSPAVPAAWASLTAPGAVGDSASAGGGTVTVTGCSRGVLRTRCAPAAHPLSGLGRARDYNCPCLPHAGVGQAADTLALASARSKLAGSKSPPVCDAAQVRISSYSSSDGSAMISLSLW
jgi:hypothetical protein